MGGKLKHLRALVPACIITIPQGGAGTPDHTGASLDRGVMVASMNVLVIEDDAEICAFVAGGLRRVGYAVDCANDGLSGEMMARNAIYDVAIVDLMLPGQDGLTLLRHIR